MPISDGREKWSASPPLSFAAPSITQDDVDAVVRTMTSGWITTGEECLALERELAAYLRCRHVVSVSSCTAALEIGLASLHLRPGSRVGVPTWTFVATALAAVHQNAVPVLLDVTPDTLNLCPDSLAAALDNGLDAVVPVHFGGVPVDTAVHKLCSDAHVPVLEDAAHALGATDHRGRVAGQGSAAACFSFYATKNLTAGEGGALATDDDATADFARSFRLHGLSVDAWARYRPGSINGYDLLGPGIKANLADPLAALARSQLGRFQALQYARRGLVERYRCNLQDIDGLEIVPSTLHDGGADHLMVVLLPRELHRPTVMAMLSAHGIPTSVHFQPLHRFGWFQANASIGPSGVAVADALASRALSLPLHPGLSVDDVDRVCHALVKSLAR